MTSSTLILIVASKPPALSYVLPYIYSVGSDLNCDLVRNLIGGLLISSAICVLALGSKKIFLLSALSNYSVI